ncbi:MAG: hypothetical protein M3R65_08065 [Gemmatimonadota bacterium]|nr:hypothetical protein [Gemmatimonadota bacterium]
MSEPTSPAEPPVLLPWRPRLRADVGGRSTESLVRETWRHYYVAQLAEAQFGPASLEASLAREKALFSYRELRSSLRDLDPYYRPAPSTEPRSTRSGRHLSLVRDDAPASAKA